MAQVVPAPGCLAEDCGVHLQRRGQRLLGLVLTGVPAGWHNTKTRLGPCSRTRADGLFWHCQSVAYRLTYQHAGLSIRD